MFTSQLAFSLFQNNSKMKEHYLHSLWGLLFFAEVLFWLQQLASQNTLKYEKKKSDSKSLHLSAESQSDILAQLSSSVY